MMISMQHSAVPVSTPSTLIDILRFRARHQTDRLAYTFLKDGETDEAHLTYGELDRQARAIGAQLQRLGATGERVLLLYPSGLEYISAFFGCLYAGSIAVPAYPPRFNRTVERLEAIVADAQATVALTTTALLSKTDHWFVQAPDLATLSWLATDSLTGQNEAEWQEPDIDGNTLAFLQYTSGSTGTPKGVMLSHGNLLNNIRMIQQSFQNTERSIGVSWLPLYHDMGLIGCLLHPLHVGFRCILMSPIAFLQRPVRWLQAISRYKATGSGAPNFAYEMCVQKVTPAQRATLDLSSWEIAFNGAEPVRQETLDGFAQTFESCGFRRRAFHPCYGLAEGTLIVSGGIKTAQPITYTVQKTALEQHRMALPCIGTEGAQTFVGSGSRLSERQRIVIVDPETCLQCPPNQIGEIWVSGPSVAQGYWNRPDETEHHFGARLADTGEGPFLRTGDLGFLHQDELFVTGRLKDVMIIRGRNHYPQDIELTVEQSHPSLRPGCGASFSVDVAGEERLVVVQEVERHHLPRRQHAPRRHRVNLDPGFEPSCPQPFDFDTLVNGIRQAVAEQHGVQAYAVVLLRAGSIPKTSSGKTQRYACRERFSAQTLDVVEQWHAPVEPEAGVPATSPHPQNAIRYARRKKAYAYGALTSGYGALPSLNRYIA